MSDVYNLPEIKTEKLSISDKWNKNGDKPICTNRIYYDNQILHIKLMHAQIKSRFNHTMIKPDQLLLYIDHEQLSNHMKPIIKHIKQMMKTSLPIPKKLGRREPEKLSFYHNFGHKKHYEDTHTKPHLMTKIFMDDVNSYKTVSGKNQCEIYDQRCQLINENPITKEHLMNQLMITSNCNLVVMPIPWVCNNNNMYGITWKICQLRLYKRNDFCALEKGKCILLDDGEKSDKIMIDTCDEGEYYITCIDDVDETG